MPSHAGIDAIAIRENDNVATALRDLAVGEEIVVGVADRTRSVQRAPGNPLRPQVGPDRHPGGDRHPEIRRGDGPRHPGNPGGRPRAHPQYREPPRTGRPRGERNQPWSLRGTGGRTGVWEPGTTWGFSPPWCAPTRRASASRPACRGRPPSSISKAAARRRWMWRGSARRSSTWARTPTSPPSCWSAWAARAWSSRRWRRESPPRGSASSSS